VLTGRLRIFDKSEISVDAVLASACLPNLFPAVEIGGEYFWDGGYMGNPPIFPLIYRGDSRDILIVQINPINIPAMPATAPEIADRVQTLSWNSSLMREMRAIHFVTTLIEKGFDDEGRLQHMWIHTIDAEKELNAFSVSSKLNADWDWLLHLHGLGRRKAHEFLSTHGDKIGVRSSTDIVAKFL